MLPFRSHVHLHLPRLPLLRIASDRRARAGCCSSVKLAYAATADFVVAIGDNGAAGGGVWLVHLVVPATVAPGLGLTHPATVAEKMRGSLLPTAQTFGSEIAPATLGAGAAAPASGPAAAASSLAAAVAAAAPAVVPPAATVGDAALAPLFSPAAISAFAAGVVAARCAGGGGGV